MSPKNTPSKYLISVLLLDLSKNSEAVLANAVQLAKSLNGSIEIFSVKAVADVVKHESQLSAIRTMHKDNRDTDAKIKALISTIEQEDGLSISYRLEYGNVKHRMRDYLALQKPDILVLGKRRSKLGFLGESIVDFVVNETSATNIFIFDEDHRLRSFEDINLGVFGGSLNERSKEIIMNLRRDSESPVRLFEIKGQDMGAVQAEYPWQHTIPYIFTQSATALDALISYVNRTQTELFCIPKGPKRTFAFQTDPVREALRKSTVPLMILG